MLAWPASSSCMTDCALSAFTARSAGLTTPHLFSERALSGLLNSLLSALLAAAGGVIDIPIGAELAAKVVKCAGDVGKWRLRADFLRRGRPLGDPLRLLGSRVAICSHGCDHRCGCHQCCCKQ